ncbi:MAG: N-methyl-L-tryptophan oxidase [Polyangiaceae bacterium]
MTATSGTYDVAVVGLGAMGTAAAFHLASRGTKVLGLERFGLAHDRGSAHGETRLIRKAYFESPAYVPLLERSYTLWDELGERVKETLFSRSGLVLLGRDGAKTTRARDVAATHGIPVETLSARDVHRRFPPIHVGDDVTGLFEPDAGYLAVEACVRAHANLATSFGADLRWNEPLREWSAEKGTIRLVTETGTYEAKRLVLAAGAWSGDVLRSLGLPLRVARVVQHWFYAGPEFEGEAGMPSYAFDMDGTFVYGFPRIGGAIKVAEHASHDTVPHADVVVREVRPSESAIVSRFVATYLPTADAGPHRSKTCLYTMTPDEHFVVDLHPDVPGVTFAAGFSGHGFKFASVMGEILADLALDGRTPTRRFPFFRTFREDSGVPP